LETANHVTNLLKYIGVRQQRAGTRGGSNSRKGAARKPHQLCADMAVLGLDGDTVV
jgi:hypothetical protein